MRVAVIGLGSIGSRHAANLRALGADVLTVDPDPERAADYRRLEELPAVDAVVVATPTDSHIDVAVLALRSGCDVFVEKPLALSGADALRLGPGLLDGRVLQVGYNLRFRPELRALRERLQVDRPVLARLEFSQRLDEWRPGRDYRGTPTARPHHEGGGILLDASHELDLLIWLFGPWAGVYGAKRTLGWLAPTTNDYAGAFVDYGDLFVELSLGMIESGYRRFIRAVHMDGATSDWSYTDDAGASLRAEMAHFLDCVARRAEPEVGLTEGLDALYLVDAIVASSERGRSIRAIDIPVREPLWHRKLVPN